MRSRDFAGRRWLGIVLRSLHLVGVVLTGGGFLGAQTFVAAGAVLMLLTGFAMYGIDLWLRPGLWREVAGAFVVVKLGVLLAMLLVPNIAELLFWVVLVASSVVSHAPRVFRHRRIIG
jgi:Zn-dependent protease with chaperone function